MSAIFKMSAMSFCHEKVFIQQVRVGPEWYNNRLWRKPDFIHLFVDLKKIRR